MRPILALTMLASIAAAQTFDAASVKVVSGDSRARMGASGPPWHEGSGCLHHPAVTMKTLSIEAYGVKAFQTAGPGWLDSDLFSINAVMPASTTREQLRVMTQNLLADRFKLVMHREAREQQVYALVVAKNGVKLKAVAGDAPLPVPKADEPEFDADRFPNPINFAHGHSGTTEFQINGRSRITGMHASMKDLADILVRRLGRPVSDETNLTPKYDFVLNFSGVNLSASEANTPMPDLLEALTAQLGLKLESRKGPVEMIAIDSVERIPTGN